MGDKSRRAVGLEEQTARALADFVKALPDPMLVDVMRGHVYALAAIQNVARKEYALRVGERSERN